tara:strand:- start:1940 stop:2146 length:207 start_codon:yes stop_codon:yes gene_type:complete
MEDLSVKQLLATTNKILIVVAVLIGLNLAADVLGLKSQDLVIKNWDDGRKVWPFIHYNTQFGVLPEGY